MNSKNDDIEEGDIVNVNFDIYFPVREDINDISGIIELYLDLHIFHSMDFSCVYF
jgi:hypothetical protein